MLITLLYFTLLVLSILPVVFLLDVLLTGKSPLVTTPARSRYFLEDTLKLDETSIFYDLGCGTGALLTECAPRFPYAKFIGVDNSPFSYAISKIRVLLSESKNISIKFANFFDVDLSPATHIYLWLQVRDMDRLLSKFEGELKPGTFLYSLDFPFSQKDPTKKIDLGKDNKFGHTVYVYEF